MAEAVAEQHGHRAKVLVAGGGHAGLLFALALDRVGIGSTVIDAQPVDQVLAAPFAGRALALMYGSKRVFEALGLWRSLAAVAEPVWSVRVEDQSSGATMVYDAHEVGDHPFGFGLENRALRRRLLERALDRPAIEIVAPARLVRLERAAERIVATLDDGRAYPAAVVIGADGRGSTVRKLAGLDGEHRRYPQTALTFAVRHSRPHEGRVREYLRPAGPLALLPIGPDLCSVTWIERAGVARYLLEGSESGLVMALRERIGDVLGTLEMIGEPAGHPLSSHQARRLTAPRIALVGDAAHGVHPIHAQGFNLAVRDVAALVEVLIEADRAGQDLGGAEALLRYQRWRSADARLIVGLTDGLNRLFSNDLGPARLVRRLGLSALDRVAPLKRLAMRRGMGLAGDLPKLARGEAL